MNPAASLAPTESAGTYCPERAAVSPQRNTTACRPTPVTDVGAAEAELDGLIRSTGEQMVAWHPIDPAVARFWLRRMDQLIAQRTANHRAAIEARIWQQIEDPCYFSSDEAHA